MKKITIILFAVLMLFVSACGKQPADEIHATSDIEISSSTAETEATISTFSQNHDTTTQPNFKYPPHYTTTQITQISGNPENNEPPHMSIHTLESIAELENAHKTMSATEFAQFLWDTENYWGSSITSQEDALKVLDEIKRTTIILLDGNKDNFEEALLYEESHFLTNTIIMNDTGNIICTYYTPYRENVKTKTLGESQKATFIKEISANGVTADVYNFDRGDKYEIYAEILVDESRIVLRVTEEQTIEEFESVFARLEFVKIGDLIKS